MNPAPASSDPGRRRFLKEMAGAAGGACLRALGSGLYSRQAGARPPTAIRPPGALAEADFLAACVRCGLCVRDCPYDTLKLGRLGDGVATGTPISRLARWPARCARTSPASRPVPPGLWTTASPTS